MNIVNFNTKKDRRQEEQREYLLATIETIREQVEAGEIQDLVALSIDSEGDLKLYASCQDFVSAVGMFELGKLALIDQEL